MTLDHALAALAAFGAIALLLRVELLGPRLRPWRTAPWYARGGQDLLALALGWEAWGFASGRHAPDHVLLIAACLCALALTLRTLLEQRQ